MNNKKKLFLVLFLLFGAIVSLYFLDQSQETRKGAYFGKVNLSVLPDEKEVGVGEDLSVKVNLSAGDYKPTYLDLLLSYDPDYLEISSSDISFNDGFEAALKKEVSGGSIRVVTTVGLTGDDALKSGSLMPVELKFKAVKQGATEITFGAVEVNGYNPEGMEDVSLEVESKNGGQYTIVESNAPEDGWPVMSFKVKFAGTEYEAGGQSIIVDDISEQKVDVVVRKGNTKKVYEDVVVTFDDQAIGTGEVSLTGINPGSGYTILIKGPVHLARRFCEDGQTDHCWLGEGDLSLASGTNEFDWSGLELEPGDINRDGVVDTADFTALKESFGESGENVPADLNRNGTVNAQDVVFFLNTLSKKYEEEI